MNAGNHRSAGSTSSQILEVINASNRGERVVLHGQNWVMMSRPIYQELTESNDITVYVDEAKELDLGETDDKRSN